MAIVFAPCANGGTPYRARGGNLVGAGKRVPLAEVVTKARDSGGQVLRADDRGRDRTASGKGTLNA